MSKNTSGIIPLEYRVLILPDVVEEKTAGGIYIPEETRQGDQCSMVEGTLISWGGMAFNLQEEKPWPEMKDSRIKPGVRVFYQKYGGELFKGDDEKDYRLMNDRDIIAIRS